ncbi:putative transcription factor interactor and regulator CCHC(Zn) family [Helianthus annuus]|uniref:Transcription factor interactor and regulator CCHC(Zn) family n=1 Tax=Helianthus annuus TaxID=4232 RepID=A0A9K3HH73_HELAN|nr:putative transcription factor interactor and regulator CCHC(Zn) family [Helianthus annuus]KAJ0863057.1 putative transcription factor interactor and regulator CCHC(Zn) family [Helianthus annuus]
MAEEFYSTLYKAFTSESSETSSVTPKTITKAINENIKHDNFYGTHSKPPTLESIEDYTWWKERFINWAKAYAHESWFCLEFGYSRPVNDKGEDLPLKSLSKEDKSEFAAEQRMIALIQSSIRNDMFALLQHDGSSKSVWEALRVKAEGGKQIKKNKIALLKKEFDLFDSLKGESVRQMIERFGHLKIELDRFGIVKPREEIIDKIIEALPRADQWQTFVFILKNDVLYDTISLDVLIEKIESHELELQKQSKMNGSSHQQNVGLYYKGNIPSVKVGDSPKTAFSGEKIKTSSSSYNPGYHSSFSNVNSEESEEVLCNIALKLKNSPAMSINAAKQQMSFLAYVLESYEGLVSGKIGNSELTKEDYDQIDPAEMELIDIRWCLASCIRRAQRYMEITGKQSIGGPSTKLGFDKSKVTYFRCKQKGHFKRECKNSEVDEAEKPFNDDYYRKAIYHRSKEEPKMIENNPKEKSRACAIIHDDEGYDWSQILPEEDRVDNQSTAHGKTISKSKHYVFVAKIKEKTREEILNEKTYRERSIAGKRIDEMQEEYEDAVSYKRWDKKRECYVNRDGEPVVPKKDIIFDDVLLVIPRFVEYYSNAERDKTYVKRLEKLIRDVMISSLRKRDEERMKKNVEGMVEELKKILEEIKDEAVKVEEVKEKADVKLEKVEKAVTKEEQFNEMKNESLVTGDVGVDAGDKKKSEADQKQSEANTKVPITKVKSDSEVLIETVEKCKKCMETCRACTEKDEQFRTRNLEFNKIEEVFKNKCKEILENEKVLKDNNENITQKCKNLEKENEILKEKISKMTEECSQKEIACQEMKKEYDSIKLAYHITKKSYEDVKSQMKLVQSRLRYYSETTDTFKRQYEIKQQVVNSYIEDVAKLKHQIADLEQDNNKLKSYHASSYVLERIFNIKPDGKDSEQNKKGIGSEFHQVPPPKKFAFYDDEKVEKAFNMVDQLPDNIDVTYSKSDDSGDSEVVGKVVESVLKEELVETGKSESQDRNEGSFHEEYLKNSKSKKKLNDDSKGLVYTMIGSDKLFLDIVFPIQNVISEKIDKVFKMVEIEKSEISKFAGKGHKTFYNKPGYKKINMKAGLGYKKKQNWKRNETPNYRQK